MEEKNRISRRTALKYLGLGAIGVAALNTSWNCSGVKKGATITYNKDKKLGVKVSMLALGCMRFPMHKNAEGKNVINRAISDNLIRTAYAKGINYFDTAYNYLGGESETVVGEVLKEFPRDSFYLTTKMPTWLIDSLETGKKVLQEQLDKLQVDYLDFYLLHALSSIADFDKAYKNTGVLEYLNEERAKGRIKHLGFSFHGDAEAMDYILSQNNWDVVMIQMNYLDWESQNAKYMYEAIEKHGVRCNVMEPLRGGLLATLNEEAVGILKEYHPDWSPASWAFRWVGSHPNVLTILSGMTDVKYIEENVATFTDFQPLTAEEEAVVAKALEAFRRIDPIPCTGCAYCMPCEFGVDIPAVFAAYNEMVAEGKVPDMNGPMGTEFYEKAAAFMEHYNKTITQENGPQKCTKCNRCKTHCPQEIDIPAQLEKISRLVRSLQRFPRG